MRTSPAKAAALTPDAIHATAGDENRLYGAVTTRDIATQLASRGLELDHKKLRLAEPIKRLGSYEVSARLATAVTATFKVNVVAK